MRDSFISMDIFTNPKKERVRITNAWEQFITGEDLDSTVRNLTYQSWERSLKHGINPLHGMAPVILPKDKIQSTYPNNHIFEKILPELKNVAIDAGHLIVFCNNNGEIVYLDGDSALKRKAEKMNFIVGASWSESHIGTNAIGTALATGMPMQVFAGEHFCQPVHNWVCSAAPIRDPATKEILGAIDLTGAWNMVHPHSLSTVVSITQYIEGMLQKELDVERFILLEQYSNNSIKNKNSILAVIDRGNQVIQATPLFYENGWIGKNNHLIDLDNLTFTLGENARWESEKRDGKWKFELNPYFYQGKHIGAIVNAIAPSSQVPKVNSTKHTFSSLIGESTKFKSFIKEARTLAGLDLPLLIEGESGTGKELLAQSIHSASQRSSGPFIAINCGAIPKDLADSELFGYEGGAFTGATKGGHSGKFQQAEGGTIFLDEIGEMSLNLQTTLLRVLEEGELVRIGGKHPIKLNIRVIAATNRDLKKATENGEFRLDLYYRLNILHLKVPSLHERSGDIPLLLDHLLKKVCRDLGRPPLTVDKKALEMIESYEWPGNVRELRNLAYKMAAKVQGNVITSMDLPEDLIVYCSRKQFGYPAPIVSNQENQSLHPTFHPHEITESAFNTSSLKDQEIQTILTVLNELNGNVSEAAKKLGIHRSTIYRKLGRNLTSNDNKYI
ncbi:sigma-54-dependent Fis family transcriptional regulator [Neobacillus niacini]|uniref:sigma-54-dependent Fis family transcriptional regulator n=1 Tax=Neobacillus niacini TaxID=86668 RepID=UPI003000B6C8